MNCGLLPRFLHSLNKYNLFGYILSLAYKLTELSIKVKSAKHFYFGDYGISRNDWIT